MKRLILTKKVKIYLLLFILFSINSMGQNAVNENHMIIKFDQNSAYTFSASAVGCTFVNNIDCINAELWCVPDEMQIGSDTFVGEEAIADYFASMGGIVEYAEPDWLVETIGTPNDPSFNQLWGMNKINAPQAWDTQTGNSGVVVGVIDTGLDWTHPDLIDNIWQNMGEDADGDGSVLEWDGSQWIFDPGDENGIDDDGNGYVDDLIGWDFHNNDNNPYDDHYHGTHVGGTIGAKGNNNTGVCGVSWDVQLMGLKFLNSFGFGSISNALLCLEYAVMNGAPISNNSWGGGPYSQAFADALQVAAQNNHLFVAAAGNYSSNNDFNPFYPAAYSNPNVLTVASTTSSDGRSGFSNYGLTSVDLGAPGTGIYSTRPNNTYGNLNGTSMAAPHVAGAAALLLSECNSLTYQEIKAALMDSTDPISALSGKCVSGGRLNVNAAMQSLPNFGCAPPIVNCLTNDSLALVALYNSTDGDNWTNTWDLSQPVSTWYGIELTADGCNVECIDMDGNNNCNTSNNAGGNNLSGVIPSEIGDLSQLKRLNLRNNQITGSIPSEIGNIANLTFLHLNTNQLTGNIPTEIGNLNNLISLLLSSNQLIGNIPSEIGNLINLGALHLELNQLSGNIPTEIGNLSNLTNLDLENNQLEGCYPQSICNLTSTNFNFINNPNLPDGGSDQGFIDFCAGNAPCPTTNCLESDSLALVALYNATDGPNWTNTWDLSQPVGSWYGVGLSGDDCNVEELQLFSNNLIGNIPSDLGNLSNLTILNLQANQLTGIIPLELGNLSNLNYLFLNANNLNSTIPIQIGNLSNLTRLYLNSNQNISGSIPNQIGNLANLEQLYLHNNSLTDNIPYELGNLSSLTKLNISENQLDGTIPTSLGNLSVLSELNLGFNNLTGNIPKELENLSNLSALSLYGNQISGIIPIELGNLTQLNFINLFGNQLTGCYPQNWCNLNLNMNYFNCTNNPNLPDSGSDQGFLDFCAGTAPLCGNCNAYDLDLGPNKSLSCGGSVTLSTGLTNMALTLWDYEGTLVGNTPNITVNAPGTYTATIVDDCGNTGIDTIVVAQSGDCVWPGDMNNDNIVNVYDVLYWGFDNGKTGPARSGGNLNWEGQACNNWSGSGPNGVNDKHSDASGNGTVGVYDLNAITQNYGNVHGSLAPSNQNTINSFIAASNVNMTNIAGANNGEIIIDLVLNKTVTNIHGLAWSIDLDFNGAIKDISFEYNSSWLGAAGPNLKVYYHQRNDKIHIAITRTDGQMVSGNGLLGHLIITEDDVIPWEDPDYNVKINIEEALKIDNQGNRTYLSNNTNGLVAANSDGLLIIAAGDVSPCQDFHIHNYSNYVDGNYQARTQITSSATIAPSAVVDYRAGEQFTIHPGFTVKSGGEFKATIEDCQ